MEWRHRKYYLISYSMEQPFNWNSIAKSIRLFPPYNHFKAYCSKIGVSYDGLAWRETGEHIPSQMLSCRLEDADEVELQMGRLRNHCSFDFCELTPTMCGQ